MAKSHLGNYRRPLALELRGLFAARSLVLVLSVPYSSRDKEYDLSCARQIFEQT
jgi:hypothetical protein